MAAFRSSPSLLGAPSGAHCCSAALRLLAEYNMEIFAQPGSMCASCCTAETCCLAVYCAGAVLQMRSNLPGAEVLTHMWGTHAGALFGAADDLKPLSDSCMQLHAQPAPSRAARTGLCLIAATCKSQACCWSCRMTTMPMWSQRSATAVTWSSFCR